MKLAFTKFFTISFLIIMASSFGCSSEPSTCANGVLDGTETGVDCGGDCSPCVSASSIMINGMPVTAQSQSAILGEWQSQGTGQNFTGGSLAIIYSLGGGSSLSVSFNHNINNQTCIPTGDYFLDDDDAFANNNDVRLATLIYTDASFTSYSATGSDNFSGLTIQLTECDGANDKISGSFSGDLEEFIGQTGATVSISGSFNNLSYIDVR